MDTSFSGKPSADWPASRFLALLGIWTGFDPERPISLSDVAPHVEAVNTLLNLSPASPARFVRALGDVPATPVPFAFQGPPGRVRAAVLGLNPGGAASRILKEKNATRDLPPPAYARFYTTARYLPHALSGPYYRNLGTLLLSMDRGRLVKFSEWCRSQHHPDRAAAFAALAAAGGVLEMRLVPFYSRTWQPAGLSRLLVHPRYGRYYIEMVDMVDDVLERDGWLIANGRDPAAVLPRLLAPRAPLVPAGENDPGAPFAFYRWKDRRVVLLRQFLRSRGGRLNSDRDLGELFAGVEAAFRA